MTSLLSVSERKAAAEIAATVVKPELSPEAKKAMADRQWERIKYWTSSVDPLLRQNSFRALIDPKIVDARTLTAWSDTLTEKGYVFTMSGDICTITIP